MGWEDQSADFGSNTLLTSDQMQKLRDNRLAWTSGNSGAPLIQSAALEDELLTAAKLKLGLQQSLVSSGNSHRHDLDPLPNSAFNDACLTNSKFSFQTTSEYSFGVSIGTYYYPAPGFYMFSVPSFLNSYQGVEILVAGSWRGVSYDEDYQEGFPLFCTGSDARFFVTSDNDADTLAHYFQRF